MTTDKVTTLGWGVVVVLFGVAGLNVFVGGWPNLIIAVALGLQGAVLAWQVRTFTRLEKELATEFDEDCEARRARRRQE